MCDDGSGIATRERTKPFSLSAHSLCGPTVILRCSPDGSALIIISTILGLPMNAAPIKAVDPSFWERRGRDVKNRRERRYRAD